ncbi:MAG: YigZ family protein [Clostridia bacterium]|nr:YigZ family protein [Clostridia bacterium]
MSNGYFTVLGEKENLIVIERSKFICYIKPVEDEIDAKNYVESIRKKHSLANHCCYAYIADDKGLVQKFSDDGEPQGTAGLPMLEVLKNKKIFKTVAVVVRYFGGIKLGTGGLTRAYAGSVADCLSVSDVVSMEQASICKVDCDYDGYSILLKALNYNGVSVVNTDFSNKVTVFFAVKTEVESDFIDKIIDAFNGKIQIEKIENRYFAFR